MKEQRKQRAGRRRQVVAKCKPLVEQIQQLTDQVEYLLEQASDDPPTPKKRRAKRRPARVKTKTAEDAHVAAGRIVEMSPHAADARGRWTIRIDYQGRQPQIVLSGRLAELFYHLVSAPADDPGQPGFRTAEQIRQAMRAGSEQTVVNLVHRLRKCMEKEGLPKQMVETRQSDGPRYRIWLAGGVPHESPAVAKSPQIRQWARMAKP